MAHKDKYEQGQRCAPYVPNGEARGDSSACCYRTMGHLLKRKGKKLKSPKREDEETRSDVPQDEANVETPSPSL